MIEKAAIILTNKLSRNNIIENEARDIYIYGFNLTISTIMNSVLILSLAFLYRRPLDAMIYILCTHPLRTNGGGWHAQTHWLCITLGAISFTIVSWACFWIWASIPWFVLFAVQIISLGIIWIRVPVEHPNNPLEDDAKRVMRLKCIVYGGVIMATSMVLIVMGQQHASVLITLSATSAVGTFLIPIERSTR